MCVSALSIILLAIVILSPACSARSVRIDFKALDKLAADWDSMNDGEVSTYITWHDASKELRYISSELSSARPSERAGVLRRLVRKTDWGSEERAAACYASAWNGVDYPRCRDYIVHVAYWYRWGNRRNQGHPFGWGSSAADMVYQLYRHNHDGVLLKWIIIDSNLDGANGYRQQERILEICERYPRGLLRLAAADLTIRKLIATLLYAKADDLPLNLQIDASDSEIKEAQRIHPQSRRR